MRSAEKHQKDMMREVVGKGKVQRSVSSWNNLNRRDEKLPVLLKKEKVALAAERDVYHEELVDMYMALKDQFEATILLRFQIKQYPVTATYSNIDKLPVTFDISCCDSEMIQN